MKIETVRVFVDDIAAAERFYATKLELPLRAGGGVDCYRVFDAGNVELVVELVAKDAPADERDLVGRFTGLSFTVSDIESVFRALSENGVHFAGEPEHQSWGGILATLRDPSGNELQLVQRPSAP